MKDHRKLWFWLEMAGIAILGILFSGLVILALMHWVAS